MLKPIRVRAKRGVLVPVPRLRGNVAEYVGREVAHEAHKSGADDHEELYPIRSEAVEFSVKADGYDVYQEMLRHVRFGDLEPADAETARTAGLTFTPPAATKPVPQTTKPQKGGE